MNAVQQVLLYRFLAADDLVGNVDEGPDGPSKAALVEYADLDECITEPLELHLNLADAFYRDRVRTAWRTIFGQRQEPVLEELITTAFGRPDEMRPEYNFRSGIRGKHAREIKKEPPA